MGEWVDNPVCELGRLHTQRVSTAVTEEEGDLLYALVRMAKPQFCLETGAGHCVSTKKIGQALLMNGFGKLSTCETRSFLVEEAVALLEDLPVSISEMKGIDLIKSMGTRPSFIFLDSGHPSDRMEELEELLSMDLPVNGGYLVIHDVLNPNDGDYRVIFETLKKYGWPHLILESNAGIAVFRRPL